jgi:hypothetical protein
MIQSADCLHKRTVTETQVEEDDDERYASGAENVEDDNSGYDRDPG